MRKQLFLAGIMLGLLTVTLGASAAKADSVTLSGSGVWASLAPTTSWSAPGEAWSFSLSLPNPTPAIALNADEMLTTAISDFSYTLSGAAVNIPPADVIFFSIGEFGGFQIDFTAGGTHANGDACSVASPCSFDVFGDQLFSGNPPNITIQPGLASTVDFDYSASVDVTNPDGTGPVGTFTVVTSTPEPATLSLLALGALGLFAKRRKK